MEPDELRERARHFREFAAMITDDQAFAAALELAREYEEQADAAARSLSPSNVGGPHVGEG